MRKRKPDPDFQVATKGARTERPFLFVLAMFAAVAAGPAAAGECDAARWDEQVSIKQVYDGDTVELTDGRHIRFIGINAPEVAHDPAPAEPLADEAKALVERAFAKDRTALLAYDAERFDVHKRTLAHLYRADKTSIEADLLRDGLAFYIAIPPNLAHRDCYAAQEQIARDQKRGIWAQSYYNPVAADRVSKDRLGFQRVRGVVQRVGQSKKSIWLNLSRTVALRVDRDDLENFAGLNLLNMKGRELVARGWLTQYKNGDLVMRVRHAAALENLDQHSQANQ